MLTLYLIHFDAKYEHAQHYLGLSNDLNRRMEEHRSGQGNPLMKAVTEAGIPWSVVRTWPDADRMQEVQLKSRHNATKLCPICNPQSWQRNANH
jgi:predicted GIY-YIG superfamily endonuclease